MRTIEKRDVAIWIVISVLTFGIAGLVWLYKITEDMNAICSDSFTTSGGLVVFLAIFFRVFMPFWGYKMGSRIDQWKGDGSGKRTLLFTLLCLFMPMLSYACIQDELNQRVDAALSGTL